ncbi:MAG: site-2 protease family protein [Candidatus Helarchaeota archaeon]
MDIIDQILWTFFFTIVFWICINGIVRLFKLQKRGVEVGIVSLVLKTTKLNQGIDKIARKFPRFWRVFFYIGIGLGYIGMGVIIYFLTINLFQLIINPQPTNAVVPLIPGITVSGMPLVYVLIAIAVIAVSHEFAHGVAARLESVKLKSVGVMILLFLFAAFVEVDEHEIAKRKKLGRLSIYAAGSYSNFVVGFFVFLIISNMYSVAPVGIEIKRVVPYGPSFGILKPKDVIIKVNGTSITNNAGFDNQISKIKPLQIANFSIFNILSNTYRNELIKTGFNPSYLSTGLSRCRFQPEPKISIVTGVNLTQLNVNMLKEIDNSKLNFESSSNQLNITLYLNISKYPTIYKNEITKIMVNITGIFNNSNNNISIYLKNRSSPSNDYLLGQFDNTQLINFEYINISSSSVNLSQFIGTNFLIECRIIVNNTSAFRMSLDEFSFYIITNKTIGWYGIYSYDYYPPVGLGKYIYGALDPHENPLFESFFYIWLLSWGIAFMNLLPIPFFDGDRLIVDLISKPGEIYPIPPKKEDTETETNGSSNKKDKVKKEKLPWTYKKTIIWVIRGIAIFLLISNIALSIYWMVMTGNYNIFEFL